MVNRDLTETIDRRDSTTSADSGSPRDQLSTIYESLVPDGFIGWGNVSTLGFSLAVVTGARLAYPERVCVNVTGDAGVAYMPDNFEALVRHGPGATTVNSPSDPPQMPHCGAGRSSRRRPVYTG